MKNLRLALLMLVTSCAGMDRGCASFNAANFGADWLIVQYRYDGEVMKCWRLENTSVSNEPQSDGIYWKSPRGHLVHLSGWYNRVQVVDKDWKGAAASLDIALEGCK